MTGYTAREIFKQNELDISVQAATLVNWLPEDTKYEIRCHELARAVYKAIPALGAMPRTCVVDGHFGGVEHSWISIPRREREVILDVYAVGAVPIVQLVALNGSIGLIGARRYIEGTPRNDIDEAQIQRLLHAWRHT